MCFSLSFSFFQELSIDCCWPGWVRLALPQQIYILELSTANRYTGGGFQHTAELGSTEANQLVPCDNDRSLTDDTVGYKLQYKYLCLNFFAFKH